MGPAGKSAPAFGRGVACWCLTKRCIQEQFKAIEATMNQHQQQDVAQVLSTAQQQLLPLSQQLQQAVQHSEAALRADPGCFTNQLLCANSSAPKWHLLESHVQEQHVQHTPQSRVYSQCSPPQLSHSHTTVTTLLLASRAVLNRAAFRV